MATKAQLLAAAKKIVAGAAKAKKSIVKRKAVAKPKRVVKRKTAAVKKGYSPNPIEVARAHAQCFHVYTIKVAKGKITGKPIAAPVKFLGSFPTAELAETFAKTQHVAVGIFKD